MRKKYLVLIMAFVVLLCPISVSAASTDEVLEQEDLARQELIDDKPVYLEDGGLKQASSSFESDGLKTSGKYPTTKGIILYTKDTVNKIAKVVGHAAIVYTPSKVVEGTADGVRLGSNNWNKKKHCRAGRVSVLSQSAMNKVADKCNSWLGKPYNWDFGNIATRTKFYCSQLVWAGYKDVANMNLNSGDTIVFPSELISDSKVMVVYKKG